MQKSVGLRNLIYLQFTIHTAQQAAILPSLLSHVVIRSSDPTSSLEYGGGTRIDLGQHRCQRSSQRSSP